MKIIVTITKEEKDNTSNAIWVDPCKHIKCDFIDCEACPLKPLAEKLRTAQHEFLDGLEKIAIGEE